MVISLLVLGSCLTAIDHSHEKLVWAIALSIVMVLSFVASFSIGMGPMVYVYCAEIFPLRLRAQGTAVGIAVNRVMSGAISMSFLSLYEAITIGGAFFLFGGIALVAWVFFYACFPETRGRALENTEMLFGKLLGWRSVLKEENKKKEIELQN
uniref:Major facilitator superfamily (MFS) profile domain-containing protein n=1 Tax=Rhizophora mucronata TaxID=61149 RepID=A0A2P2NFG6_RHIMU